MSLPHPGLEWDEDGTSRRDLWRHLMRGNREMGRIHRLQYINNMTREGFAFAFAGYLHLLVICICWLFAFERVELVHWRARTICSKPTNVALMPEENENLTLRYSTRVSTNLLRRRFQLLWNPLLELFHSSLAQGGRGGHSFLLLP